MIKVIEIVTQRITWCARPDFAELDVFLCQHNLLEQHFIQKCSLDHFPTPKPNLNHE